MQLLRYEKFLRTDSFLAREHSDATASALARAVAQAAPSLPGIAKRFRGTEIKDLLHFPLPNERKRLKSSVLSVEVGPNARENG